MGLLTSHDSSRNIKPHMNFPSWVNHIPAIEGLTHIYDGWCLLAMSIGLLMSLLREANQTSWDLLLTTKSGWWFGFSSHCSLIPFLSTKLFYNVCIYCIYIYTYIYIYYGGWTKHFMWIQCFFLGCTANTTGLYKGTFIWGNHNGACNGELAQPSMHICWRWLAVSNDVDNGDSNNNGNQTSIKNEMLVM